LAYDQQNIRRVDDIFTNFRLHASSKSVAEAGLFEKESERLILSLFDRLNAPAILKAQILKGIEPAVVMWPEKIVKEKYILAAFASFYAERTYVMEDMPATVKFMQLVKKYKGWHMNTKEIKLWIVTCLLPSWLLWKLKKKQGIKFCV
jgi:hypothetical protein